MQRSIAAATLILVAAGCGGGGGNDPTDVVGPAPVTLQDVQASVLTPNCAVSGCHVGAGAPFGLDLSAGQSFSNVVGVPSTELPDFQRVEPLDAADSYLFMKVTGDPRIQGDPMPAQGAPLSDRNLQLLADWIEQGASP